MQLFQYFNNCNNCKDKRLQYNLYKLLCVCKIQISWQIQGINRYLCSTDQNPQRASAPFCSTTRTEAERSIGAELSTRYKLKSQMQTRISTYWNVMRMFHKRIYVHRSIVELSWKLIEMLIQINNNNNACFFNPSQKWQFIEIHVQSEKIS